jgi:hypothetical protein
MTISSLYHLVSPIGAYLKLIRAESRTEAYVLAAKALASLGRLRGRVRDADPRRTSDWEATISLSRSEVNDWNRPSTEHAENEYQRERAEIRAGWDKTR